MDKVITLWTKSISITKVVRSEWGWEDVLSLYDPHASGLAGGAAYTRPARPDPALVIGFIGANLLCARRFIAQR